MFQVLFIDFGIFQELKDKRTRQYISVRFFSFPISLIIIIHCQPWKIQICIISRSGRVIALEPKCVDLVQRY